MHRAFRVGRVVAVLALLAGGPVSTSAATEKLMLDGCRVVTDPDLPSYVHYAVQDLCGYLEEIAGVAPRVATALDAAADVTILVGPQSVQQVLGQHLQAAQPDGEGFIVKSAQRDGKHYVAVAGASAHGTKYALARLMKLLRAEGTSAFIDSPVDLASTPAFAKRGMHFNGWAFGYPYTFRGWREADWQRYLDILAYQGINLFYLWPFIEIMPVPLSDADRAYLEECRRVVEYAQQKHGMEVWIMQCTNRVARDRCGVEDPRCRPYWRPAQEDLNPGNPEHFQAIMASREALYRIVDNVDGVCNIDSDPGAYAGSSLGDYLKVLRGCRNLLDSHNVHGKRAKLINWMWFGWGLPPQRAFEPAHQVSTIDSLRQQLPEPWWLVNGTFAYLPLCREQGVLEKTVLLPYGIIEGEPSYPATNVQIDAMRAAFDQHIAQYRELAGVMGNVQTPLLQFPHVYYYTSCIWDLDYRQRSEKDVLLDLAAELYPEQPALIADCYGALKETEPGRVNSLAHRLESLIAENGLGRPGVLGRKLFPDHHVVAKSLVLQLKLVAAREYLAQELHDNTDQQRCVQLLADYVDAYLAWDTAHGWHALWGWGPWPLGTFTSDPRFPKMAANLSKSLGSPAAVDAFFTGLAQLLALDDKYDERAIQEGCLAPLKNAVLAARSIDSLAQRAQATASVSPDPQRYPTSAANDGVLSTLYWPGALVENNTQWLQLTWDAPQTFDKVVVHFLQHPSMHGRTIHLQQFTAAGAWEDLATTVIPNDATAPHAVATFHLPSRVTLDRVRVVNLLDLFEIEVH